MVILEAVRTAPDSTIIHMIPKCSLRETPGLEYHSLNVMRIVAMACVPSVSVNRLTDHRKPVKKFFVFVTSSDMYHTDPKVTATLTMRNVIVDK